MSELMNRFRNLPAAALSDCYRGMHTLHASIRCLTPGFELAGPAFTVLAEAGSILTVHKALLEAPAGTVLVVGGETGRGADGALFGKLMALQAQLREISGLVVDGLVRDVVGLRQVGFPVFAYGTTPRVGVNRKIGQTQVPTPCGGIIVNPGDWIRGDDDGVAVIPAAELEQVVAAAEQRLQQEAEYVRRMNAGEQLGHIIGLADLITEQKGAGGAH